MQIHYKKIENLNGLYDYIDCIIICSERNMSVKYCLLTTPKQEELNAQDGMHRGFFVENAKKGKELISNVDGQWVKFIRYIEIPTNVIIQPQDDQFWMKITLGPRLDIYNDFNMCERIAQVDRDAYIFSIMTEEE